MIMLQSEKATLDRDLAELHPDQRWREWMRRIEAVLFASATPVTRDNLAKVVGQTVSIDLLIEDLIFDLADRPYAVMQIGSGWILRTKNAYSSAIRAAADIGGQAPNLSKFDMAVLAAIAIHQPISRDGLKDIFGKEISRDQIRKLTKSDLIGAGPREPRRGAPYTFVTTQEFLTTFGMETLRNLPDAEQLADAGISNLLDISDT
jgi:segregation and condensation protein B